MRPSEESKRLLPYTQKPFFKELGSGDWGSEFCQISRLLKCPLMLVSGYNLKGSEIVHLP